MKWRNALAPRDAVQRGAPDLAADRELPFPVPVVGHAAARVEPADGGGDIPGRITRECRRGDIHLALHGPVRAAGTADATTAAAVAAPFAAVHGGLTLTPPDRGRYFIWDLRS